MVSKFGLLAFLYGALMFMQFKLSTPPLPDWHGYLGGLTMFVGGLIYVLVKDNEK